ncbi:hypothetical protein U0070_001097 [Myodes glareolus]|uniref:Uncharacterized protein n=1 Tax=Myodes glareolus TaxID=447135 RepID=A0AAW0IXU8_MYOGA
MSATEKASQHHLEQQGVPLLDGAAAEASVCVDRPPDWKLPHLWKLGSGSSSLPLAFHPRVKPDFSRTSALCELKESWSVDRHMPETPVCVSQRPSPGPPTPRKPFSPRTE